MYTIGIRVSTKKIYYCIIESNNEEFELIKISCLNIPQAIEIPEQFAYIRTNLLAVIQQYNVTHASLRITENIAQNPSVYRINIEGVIQELFANSNVEKYAVMQIANIAGALEDEKSKVKSYIEGQEVFAEMDEWSTYKKEERECILAAVAKL